MNNSTHNALACSRTYNLTQNVTGLFAYSYYSLPVNIVIIILFITLVTWTILGNLTVIIAILQDKTLRNSPSNVLIANLAASDLLLGITILPFSASFDVFGFWPFGRELCFMWLVLDVLVCTASIWSLVVIAIDRYTATFYPMWYRSDHQVRRTIVYVAIVWVVSTLTSIPPLFGFGSMSRDSWDESSQPVMCVLFANVDFVLYSSAMTFIVPAAVLIIIYGKIFTELRRRSIMRSAMKSNYKQSLQNESLEKCARPEDILHSSYAGEELKNAADDKETKRQQSESSLFLNGSLKTDRKVSEISDNERYNKSQRASEYFKKVRQATVLALKRPKLDRKDKREERATKIMLTVMIIFVVCWLPFFIMYITRSIIKKTCLICPTIPDELQKLVIWLGYINSAINPLIYTIVNRQYSQAFKNIWCVLCNRGKPKPVYIKKTSTLSDER